ncbi:hypothetical protein Hypma_002800 [Hypsizygus marmoreus]|uniref:TLC domain-containing protein n=1 Tax=Hypsizygus marmoreus TaxID=39966 RepID=A0A369J3J5_HYPMA|nr:hypothetical protein Hypma_002800 [Hypsizygus marmoreus]
MMIMDAIMSMFHAIDTTLLHDSILRFTSSTLFLSFLGLVLAFHLLVSTHATTRQTSWILTTITSGIMSLASLPFLWDYISKGGSVKYIRTLPAFAVAMNRFFQAYLAADLTIGSIYYRSSISLLEGWVHHAIYILVVELAIRQSWAHIFCLCASMEIPTFVLGISTLYPRLRNNILFATSFFMTRICLHIILGISYFFTENRVHATGGSIIPALLLTLILPLHVMWFVGCVKGFIRRAAQKRSAQLTPSVFALNIVPSATNFPSTAMKPISQSTFTFPPSLPTRHNFRLRLSHRRQSFERAFRSLRLDFLELPSVASQRVFSSRKVLAYLPPRETVFGYVGLGRKNDPQFKMTTDVPDIDKSGTRVPVM